MPRLDLPELEDQPWFSPRLRNLMTEHLHVMIDLLDIYRPVVPKLAAAMRATGDVEVLDLCSGGSGPWRRVLARLGAEHGLSARVTLTDLYPNLRAFRRAQASAPDGALRFRREPVDATAVPSDLLGFRTLFTCLHHFSPAMVGQILGDAVQQRRGVGAFELSSRSPLGVLASVVGAGVTPLMPLVVRPWRADRFLLTYALPALPLCFAWDGFASQLRSYTADELRDIAQGVPDADTYTWGSGAVWHPYLPMRLTYLIGTPNQTA
jgi:hypothetical protein